MAPAKRPCMTSARPVQATIGDVRRLGQERAPYKTRHPMSIKEHISFHVVLLPCEASKALSQCVNPCGCVRRLCHHMLMAMTQIAPATGCKAEQRAGAGVSTSPRSWECLGDGVLHGFPRGVKEEKRTFHHSIWRYIRRAADRD